MRPALVLSAVVATALAFATPAAAQIAPGEVPKYNGNLQRLHRRRRWLWRRERVVLRLDEHLLGQPDVLQLQLQPELLH